MVTRTLILKMEVPYPTELDFLISKYWNTFETQLSDSPLEFMCSRERRPGGAHGKMKILMSETPKPHKEVPQVGIGLGVAVLGLLLVGKETLCEWL